MADLERRYDRLISDSMMRVLIEHDSYTNFGYVWENRGPTSPEEEEWCAAGTQRWCYKDHLGTIEALRRRGLLEVYPLHVKPSEEPNVPIEGEPGLRTFTQLTELGCMLVAAYWHGYEEDAV